MEFRQKTRRQNVWSNILQSVENVWIERYDVVSPDPVWRIDEDENTTPSSRQPRHQNLISTYYVRDDYADMKDLILRNYRLIGTIEESDLDEEDFPMMMMVNSFLKNKLDC